MHACMHAHTLRKPDFLIADRGDIRVIYKMKPGKNSYLKRHVMKTCNRLKGSNHLSIQSQEENGIGGI